MFNYLLFPRRWATLSVFFNQHKKALKRKLFVLPPLSYLDFKYGCYTQVVSILNLVGLKSKRVFFLQVASAYVHFHFPCIIVEDFSVVRLNEGLGTHHNSRLATCVQRAMK